MIVDFYEQVGYLPDAIVNYLLLLGWSLDDKTEFFTRQEMIRHFSLERVNKAAASFDVKKLLAFQERYMALEPVERKRLGAAVSDKGQLIPEPTPPMRYARYSRRPPAGERLKWPATSSITPLFVPDDRLVYDEKAFNQYVRKPPANGVDKM